MNLSELCIRRPVMVVLLSISLVLVGVLAYLHIPVAALLAAQRQLPLEMTDLPSYRKVNPADSPILFMHMSSPSMSLSELNDYAENMVSPAISTLPGIAQVTVNGGKRFAVRVRARSD